MHSQCNRQAIHSAQLSAYTSQSRSVYHCTYALHLAFQFRFDFLLNASSKQIKDPTAVKSMGCTVPLFPSPSALSPSRYLAIPPLLNFTLRLPMLNVHPVVCRLGWLCGSLFTMALTLRAMPLPFTSAAPENEILHRHIYSIQRVYTTTTNYVYIRIRIYVYVLSVCGIYTSPTVGL